MRSSSRFIAGMRSGFSGSGAGERVAGSQKWCEVRYRGPAPARIAASRERCDSGRRIGSSPQVPTPPTRGPARRKESDCENGAWTSVRVGLPYPGLKSALRWARLQQNGMRSLARIQRTATSLGALTLSILMSSSLFCTISVFAGQRPETRKRRATPHKRHLISSLVFRPPGTEIS